MGLAIQKAPITRMSVISVRSAPSGSICATICQPRCRSPPAHSAFSGCLPPAPNRPVAAPCWKPWSYSITRAPFEKPDDATQGERGSALHPGWHGKRLFAHRHGVSPGLDQHDGYPRARDHRRYRAQPLRHARPKRRRPRPARKPLGRILPEFRPRHIHRQCLHYLQPASSVQRFHA